MENLGYLLADIARRLRRQFDDSMRSIGLTGPQARLLVILARHEGEQQGFYAGMLDVEPISLCRMVDRMVEAGLIERRPDPADRRARLIYLTDKARKLGERINVPLDSILSEMTCDFEPEERTQLHALLSRLSERLTMMNSKEEAING